jgi:hypothetical protein
MRRVRSKEMPPRRLEHGEGQLAVAAVYACTSLHGLPVELYGTRFVDPARQ